MNMMKTVPFTTALGCLLRVGYAGAQTLAPSTAPFFTSPPTAAPVVVGSTSPPTISSTTWPSVAIEVVAAMTPAPSSTPVPPTSTSLPTTVPVATTTSPPVATTRTAAIFTGPPECSMNAACAGLIDDCCPTLRGIYLDCCFEEPPITLFSKEFAFVGPDGEDDYATVFVSTSNYTVNATAPDGSFPVVEYARNPEEFYDLIYYATDAITDPYDYINGTKKFYLDVYSTAPPCTHVLLQLDSLPLAEAEYPTGRHSRFIAFTNSSDQWERLEFEFLDLPDEGMDLNVSSVNSLVLFFEPGTNTSDTFYFRSLDSAIAGCDELTETCEDVMSNMCLSTILGENCTTLDEELDEGVDCGDVFALVLALEM